MYNSRQMIGLSQFYDFGKEKRGRLLPVKSAFLLWSIFENSALKLSLEQVFGRSRDFRYSAKIIFLWNSFGSHILHSPQEQNKNSSSNAFNHYYFYPHLIVVFKLVRNIHLLFCNIFCILKLYNTRLTPCINVKCTLFGYLRTLKQILLKLYLFSFFRGDDAWISSRPSRR